MRCRSLVLFAVLAFFVACGGGSGGDDDGNNTPDAAPVVDAAPDAPAELSGLGQKCGQGLPACPASAPQCLSAGGAATGFCSFLCHADAQFMTDAQGQVSGGTDLTADNAKCTSIFTGSPGSGECGLPVNTTPMPTMPIQKNTTFTFQAFCVISCGAGNTCPTGFTCNTSVNWCLPS